MWLNSITRTRSTNGREELLNITPLTCGSSHDSIRRVRRNPHRINGRRRSQKRGTTRWTLPQDGLKPAPPTHVHPLMTKNAKNYEKKDGVSGAGNRDTLVDTALTNHPKHGGTPKKRNPR